MDTIDEDEGDKAVFFFYPGLMLAFLLLACANSPKENKSEKVLAVAITDSPATPPKDSLIIPAVKNDKKKIYLTFDDGPNKGSHNLLQLFKEEKVPVTFFVVGVHVHGSPGQTASWDSMKLLPNAEICNHSFTHALFNHFDKFYKQPSTVINDFIRSKDSLHLNNFVVRTPGRNSWRIDSLRFTDNKKSKPAIDSLQEAGFSVVGWDLEWAFDHKTLKPIGSAELLMSQIDYLMKNGKTRRPGNLVLLAHDQMYQSKSDLVELQKLIAKIKARDEYELSLLSQYPGLSKSFVDTAQNKPVSQ
jgi:peptidoglycan/xylan/chitin deacetylase (PgdA/CDA1 family)